MDIENLVYKHNGILLSWKKYYHLYNNDVSRGYYAKWNESEKDRYYMIVLIYWI